MKGLIFMVIVTLVVLASFARPEKEISSPTKPTTSNGMNTANNIVSPDSSTVNYKKG